MYRGIKKIYCFILGISLIFQLSCSKDESIKNDPIIGFWTLTELYLDDEKVEDPCIIDSTVEILENGDYSEIIYSYNNYDDENNVLICLPENSSGTWKNEGKGEYSFKFGSENIETKVTLKGSSLTIEHQSSDGEHKQSIVFERKQKDIVLGSWRIVKFLDENGKDRINECSALGTIDFFYKNSTFIKVEPYISDDDPKECNVDGIEGTWINEGDSKYKLSDEFIELEAQITFKNGELTISPVEGGFTSVYIRE